MNSTTSSSSRHREVRRSRQSARVDLLAVHHEQPGEDVPRVRRQLEKTLQARQACSAREARSVLIRVRPEVRSSIGASGVSHPNSEALSLGNARWTMEQKRYESERCMVRRKVRKETPDDSTCETPAALDCQWAEAGLPPGCRLALAVRWPGPTFMVAWASLSRRVGWAAIRLRASE